MDQDEHNGHDFNFESLDKRNNIIPFELFRDEQCLLKLPTTWFKEFDDLLSIQVVNLLCNAIVDIVDLEKDKKDGSGDSKHKKVNRNPMYVSKTYLKRPRIVLESNEENNTTATKHSLSPSNISQSHSHSHSHSYSHGQSHGYSQSHSGSMSSHSNHTHYSHHSNYSHRSSHY